MDESRFFRISAATYFILAGILFMFTTSLGGPSLWYFICASVLFLVGPIWLWRPDFAAGLSLVPVLGLVLIFKVCTGAFCIVLALVLAGTVMFIFVVYRKRSGQKLIPLMISLIIVLSAIATDKLFTNINKIVVFQMNWTDDGHAPWGDVGPITDGGQPVVVLYRRVVDSYCYDAVYSSELRDALRVAGRDPVPVEYNTFHDFGKLRSYNIRSVGGVLLNEGQKAIRPANTSGGQILGGGKVPDCW
jgi:hypothetical protein